MIEDIDLDDDDANAEFVVDRLLRRNAGAGGVRAWERYAASWPTERADIWWCSYSGESNNPSALEPWSRSAALVLSSDYDGAVIELSLTEQARLNAAEQIHRIALEHCMYGVDAEITVFIERNETCDGIRGVTERYFYTPLGARFLYERTIYALACDPDRALLRNARRMVRPATGLSDPTNDEIFKWLRPYKEFQEIWAEQIRTEL